MQRLPAIATIEYQPKAAAVKVALGRSTTAPSLVATVGLSPMLIHILTEVQRELGYEQSKGLTQPTLEELEIFVARVAARLGIELSKFERDEVLGYIEREQRPFGILQELVDDLSVSDIIVTNYARIAIQQGRRNIATDLSFANQETYQAF